MEQKKFDYNSLIGMILLGAIFLWYANSQTDEVDPEKEATEVVVDSTETSEKTIDVSEKFIENDSLRNASLSNKLGVFSFSAINAKEGTSVLENNLLKLTVDNKGGQIIEALVKNYKTYDSLPLYLIKDNNSNFNINFGTTDNRILNTKDLFFKPTFSKNGKNQVLSMKLKVSDNQFLEYRYEMKPNDYMLGFSIKSQGLNNVINSANDINLDWDLKGYRHEKSMRTENTMYSYYYYKSDDEVDWLNAGDTETINDVNWVSYQQQFFSSILMNR